MNSFTRPLGGATAALFFLACLSAAALAADSPGAGEPGPAPSPKLGEKGPRVLINHVGFAPRAAKCCLIEGTTPDDLEMVDVATGQTAFRESERVGPGKLNNERTQGETRVRSATIQNSGTGPSPKPDSLVMGSPHQEKMI
jgi:hypothetical protein